MDSIFEWLLLTPPNDFLRLNRFYLALRMAQYFVPQQLLDSDLINFFVVRVEPQKQPQYAQH